MTIDPESPSEYLVGHVEDALARDPRVTEQGLHASVETNPLTVVITGTVASSEHKAEVPAVVAGVLPGARIIDNTVVGDYPEPAESEQVS